MKFSKLLVLSVLSLFGLGAQAVELIERTAPEAPATTTVDVASLDKTPATFVVGNYYVIFNKGAQQYFGEGNAWGTQASLSDTPNLVRFTLPAGKTSRSFPISPGSTSQNTESQMKTGRRQPLRAGSFRCARTTKL